MSDYLEFLMRAVFIGIGATLLLDAWSVFLQRVLGAPPVSWGMVGRWFGHFPRGRFVHENIAAAAPVRGERIIGWSAHYIIGIVFALVLLAIAGLDWARQPSLLPAMIVGLCTVLAPFLLLQPGMGAGIAASRMPKPAIARLRSLVTHGVFGLGMYVSAWLLARLI